MPFKLNAQGLVGNILKGRSVKSTALSALPAAARGAVRSLTKTGGMELAAVHITNLDTGDRLSLAWTPDKIQVSGSGRFQTYNIIEEGEVKIPRGLNLKKVKWASKLPGEARKGYGFIHSSYWQEPKAIIGLLEDWREKRAKLRLLVTRTPINLDVFLDSLDYDFSGGHGDADYDIQFIQAKDMLIKTVQETGAAGANAEAPPLEARPSAPQAESIATTASMNSCWDAAQKALGDGSRWQDIFDLNAGKIGVSRDSVAPGTVLKLPA